MNKISLHPQAVFSLVEHRLINAIAEMKIRILCVKTRLFKLKDCFFIVKYKIHIKQYRKLCLQLNR